MNDRKRMQRREIRLIQRESTWLQKALFALGKAEEAREALAELKGDEPEAFQITVEGRDVSLEGLEDALDGRIQKLMEEVRERRRKIR
jgi:hypothetical protein